MSKSGRFGFKCMGEEGNGWIIHSTGIDPEVCWWTPYFNWLWKDFFFHIIWEKRMLWVNSGQQLSQGARRNCTSVPTIYEAAQPPLYVANTFFIRDAAVLGSSIPPEDWDVMMPILIYYSPKLDLSWRSFDSAFVYGKISFQKNPDHSFSNTPQLCCPKLDVTKDCCGLALISS